MKKNIILSLLALAILVPDLSAVQPRQTFYFGQEWHPNAVRKATGRAESTMLASPEGVAYHEKIWDLEQEINKVHEKYINIFYAAPDTAKGKALRAERKLLLDSVLAQRQKINSEYAELKKTSPVYLTAFKEQLRFWQSRER